MKKNQNEENHNTYNSFDSLIKAINKNTKSMNTLIQEVLVGEEDEDGNLIIKKDNINKNKRKLKLKHNDENINEETNKENNDETKPDKKINRSIKKTSNKKKPKTTKRSNKKTKEENLEDSIESLSSTIEELSETMEDEDSNLGKMSSHNEEIEAQLAHLAELNEKNTSIFNVMMNTAKKTASVSKDVAMGLAEYTVNQMQVPTIFDPKEDLRQFTDSLSKVMSLGMGGPVGSYGAAMIGSLTKSAFGGLKNIIGRDDNDIPEEQYYSDIPEYNTGGVVPGEIGKKRLVIAHAGETILPTHEKDLDEINVNQIIEESEEKLNEQNNKTTKKSKSTKEYKFEDNLFLSKLDILIELQTASIKEQKIGIEGNLVKIAEILNYGNDIFSTFMDPIKMSIKDINKGIKNLDFSFKGFIKTFPSFIIKDVLFKVLGKDLFWNLLIKNIGINTIGRGIIWGELLQPVLKNVFEPGTVGKMIAGSAIATNPIETTKLFGKLLLGGAGIAGKTALSAVSSPIDTIKNLLSGTDATGTQGFQSKLGSIIGDKNSESITNTLNAMGLHTPMAMMGNMISSPGKTMMGAVGGRILSDFWRKTSDIPYQQLEELRLIKENVADINENTGGKGIRELGALQSFSQFLKSDYGAVSDVYKVLNMAGRTVMSPLSALSSSITNIGTKGFAQSRQDFSTSFKERAGEKIGSFGNTFLRPFIGEDLANKWFSDDANPTRMKLNPAEKTNEILNNIHNLLINWSGINIAYIEDETEEKIKEKRRKRANDIINLLKNSAQKTAEITAKAIDSVLSSVFGVSGNVASGALTGWLVKRGITPGAGMPGGAPVPTTTANGGLLSKLKNALGTAWAFGKRNAKGFGLAGAALATIYMVAKTFMENNSPNTDISSFGGKLPTNLDEFRKINPTASVKDFNNYTSNLFGNSIPSFKTGGTIPGAADMPQLAITHGGEKVIPRNGKGKIPEEYSYKNLSQINPGMTKLDYDQFIAETFPTNSSIIPSYVSTPLNYMLLRSIFTPKGPSIFGGTSEGVFNTKKMDALSKLLKNDKFDNLKSKNLSVKALQELSNRGLIDKASFSDKLYGLSNYLSTSRVGFLTGHRRFRDMTKDNITKSQRNVIPKTKFGGTGMGLNVLLSSLFAEKYKRSYDIPEEYSFDNMKKQYPELSKEEYDYFIEEQFPKDKFSPFTMMKSTAKELFNPYTFYLLSNALRNPRAAGAPSLLAKMGLGNVLTNNSRYLPKSLQADGKIGKWLLEKKAVKEGLLSSRRLTKAGDLLSKIGNKDLSLLKNNPSKLLKSAEYLTKKGGGKFVKGAGSLLSKAGGMLNSTTTLKDMGSKIGSRIGETSLGKYGSRISNSAIGGFGKQTAAKVGGTTLGKMGGRLAGRLGATAAGSALSGGLLFPLMSAGFGAWDAYKNANTILGKDKVTLGDRLDVFAGKTLDALTLGLGDVGLETLGFDNMSTMIDKSNLLNPLGMVKSLFGIRDKSRDSKQSLMGPLENVNVTKPPSTGSIVDQFMGNAGAVGGNLSDAYKNLSEKDLSKIDIIEKFRNNIGLDLNQYSDEDRKKIQALQQKLLKSTTKIYMQGTQQTNLMYKEIKDSIGEKSIGLMAGIPMVISSDNKALNKASTEYLSKATGYYNRVTQNVISEKNIGTGIDSINSYTDTNNYGYTLSEMDEWNKNLGSTWYSMFGLEADDNFIERPLKGILGWANRGWRAVADTLVGKEKPNTTDPEDPNKGLYPSDPRYKIQNPRRDPEFPEIFEEDIIPPPSQQQGIESLLNSSYNKQVPINNNIDSDIPLPTQHQGSENLINSAATNYNSKTNTANDKSIPEYNNKSEYFKNELLNRYNTAMDTSQLNFDDGSGKLDINKLQAYVKQNEGFVPNIYNDGKKYKTIGYGHKLVEGDPFVPGKTYSKAELEEYFQKDFADAIKSARKTIPNFDQLNPNQQAALIDMSFNMGSVAEFKTMITRLKQGRFEDASVEVLDSNYRKDVKEHRAYRNAALISMDSLQSGTFNAADNINTEQNIDNSFIKSSGESSDYNNIIKNTNNDFVLDELINYKNPNNTIVSDINNYKKQKDIGKEIELTDSETQYMTDHISKFNMLDLSEPVSYKSLVASKDNFISTELEDIKNDLLSTSIQSSLNDILTKNMENIVSNTNNTNNASNAVIANSNSTTIIPVSNNVNNMANNKQSNSNTSFNLDSLMPLFTGYI